MTTNGADVQIERGNFTRIHNTILEQLANHDFSSREYACILYLLRMTYGFNRKEWQISNGDFAKATNIERPAVIKTLRRLVERNVIQKLDGDPYHAATWSFNKYFEQWDSQTSVKTITSQDEETSIEMTTSQTDTSYQIDTSSSYQIDTTTSAETTPSYISAKDSIKDNKDSSREAAAVFACWKDNMPGTMSSILADDLGDLIDTYGADIVIRAITEAVRSNGRSIRYVAKILENWATGKGKRSAEPAPSPAPVPVVMAGFSFSETIGG